MRWMPLLIATSLPACAEEATEPVPVDLRACEIRGTEDWTLRDAGTSAEDPTAIEVGVSYTLNLPPNAAGYVQLDLAAGGPYVAFADALDTLSAASSGGAPVMLDAPAVNRRCDESLPESTAFEAPAGALLLELGPSFQASVWFLVLEG